MINNLYKPADVALILGTSKSLIYRMVSEGQLPAVRFGRTVRVRSEDLEKFISDNLTRNECERLINTQLN